MKKGFTLIEVIIVIVIIIILASISIPRFQEARRRAESSAKVSPHISSTETGPEENQETTEISIVSDNTETKVKELSSRFRDCGRGVFQMDDELSDSESGYVFGDVLVQFLNSHPGLKVVTVVPVVRERYTRSFTIITEPSQALPAEKPPMNAK